MEEKFMNKKWLGIFLVFILIFVIGCESPETIEVIGEAVEESSEEIEDLEKEIKELGNDGEKEVVIGGKSTAEQYILVEILSQLIEEHTDLFVKKEFGITGGTIDLHQALVDGEIDMYPEYSDTAWLLVLKEELISNPDELYNKTKEAYEEEFNIVWLEPYGFNNTLTIAMKRQKAEDMEIKTISDLAGKSSELKFGGEKDFYEREHGFTKLSNLYGLNFQEEKEIEAALKYKAIKEEEVDVINGYLTDALLKEYDMKVLKDDKDFFSSYKAATIVKRETLGRFSELEAVLNKLAGQITEEEILEMNFKVEKENQDPEDVAEEFLEKIGLKDPE